MIKYMVLKRLETSEISDMIKNYLENLDNPDNQKECQESIRKFLDDSICQATKHIRDQIPSKDLNPEPLQVAPQAQNHSIS